MAILSSAVSAGDAALASAYNNLRTDLLTGDVAIAGVKTFSSIPVFSAGITLSDDSSIADGKKINFSTDGYIRSHPSTANLIQIASTGGAILNIGATDINIPATQKFYLDGGGDTYIVEGSANYVSFVTGGSSALELTAQQHVVLQTTKRLYLDGGGDTYIVEVGANQPALVAGASTVFQAAAGVLYVRRHLYDYDGGTWNIGNAGFYWNDISYKTLTDRGCLGCFDDGVELQDGRKVSDIEALIQIKKHPTKKTLYGIPMLDYKTFPKVSYKIAEIDGKLLQRDSNDEPIKGADGIEMTSIFSIMIGAFKDINKRLIELEKKQ